MSDTGQSATAKVLLLNDDEPTMEFVVQVLEGVFEKPREEALKLMLEIHRDGSGECGANGAADLPETLSRADPASRRKRPRTARPVGVAGADQVLILSTSVISVFTLTLTSMPSSSSASPQ